MTNKRKIYLIIMALSYGVATCLIFLSIRISDNYLSDFILKMIGLLVFTSIGAYFGGRHDELAQQEVKK